MATANDQLQSGRKLALVIGNDTYTQPANRLKTSVANADQLSERLAKIGFEVAKHTDVRTEEFSNAFKTLRNSVENDDMILFYFSGHAYQVNNHNYLIPTDDHHLAHSLDVETSAISIDSHIKRLLKEKRPSAAVFVLDCSKPYVLHRPHKSQSNVCFTRKLPSHHRIL